MVKRGILIGILATLLIAGNVLAAAYTASIIVTDNSSVSYAELSVSAPMDNAGMADDGFISGSGLDTRVLEGGTELLHMLADNRTLFSANITADTQHLFSYTTGNSLLSGFPVIIGYGGSVNVTDDDSLELQGDFIIEVSGRFDTANTTGKNILYKENAFNLFVSPTVSGNITVSITGGNSLTATDVSSGVHDIVVTANVTHWWIEVDTVLKDTQTLSANMTDNSNPWTMFANNVMPYVEYIKIWAR